MILIIIAFPMYWLITTSFKVPADTTANPPVIMPTRFTLDNYVNAFKTAGVPRAFANSIIVAIAATLFTTLLGSMAAYALAKSYLAYAIRRASHDLDPHHPHLPAGHHRHSLLRDRAQPAAGRHAHRAHPHLRRLWAALRHLAHARILPGYAAPRSKKRPSSTAAPSGSGSAGSSCRWHFPGLAVTSIFAFIYSWNELLYASMLTSFNAKTIPVVVSGFISDQFLRWGEMTAIGTLMIIPVLIFAAGAQRYLVRGLTFGAVKG